MYLKTSFIKYEFLFQFILILIKKTSVLIKFVLNFLKCTFNSFFFRLPKVNSTVLIPVLIWEK